MIVDLQHITPLITEKEISAKVRELGDQINRHYCDYRSVYVIGILRGCFIFLTDLMRHLRFPILIDFMTVHSYAAATESSGVVQVIKDLNVSLKDKHVLVVEDIVDTRLSLATIDRMLRARQPAEIKYCALLDKPDRKKNDIKVDWVGFTIPDEFVVGYGLDYAEKYRNLSFIGSLKHG